MDSMMLSLSLAAMYLRDRITSNSQFPRLISHQSSLRPALPPAPNTRMSDLARSLQSFLPSSLGPEKQEEAPLLNLVMGRTPATVWVGGGVREFISSCSGKGSHFATKKQSRRSPRAR